MTVFIEGSAGYLCIIEFLSWGMNKFYVGTQLNLIRRIDYWVKTNSPLTSHPTTGREEKGKSTFPLTNS